MHAVDRNRLLVVLLVCVLRTTAVSEEIEVGSREEAAHAFQRSRPGDAILLADGEYKDFRVVLHAKGAPDKPITFRARTAGKVTFTGDVHLRITGQHVTVSGFVFDQAWGRCIVQFLSARHCRLTECAFVESGNPASSYSHMITIRGGSQHNRVDHCYLQGNLSMGMGVRLSKGDFENLHNRFDHNYFKDITRRWSNGQEAIQFGQGGLSDRLPLHGVAEYNLFVNASGDAEIISNKSCANVIRYNTFRNCKAMLVLRGGSHARVQGNFFFHNSGGIRVHDGYHVIVNNYIEGSRRAGIYMPAAAGDAEHTYYGPVNYCVVAHNTIVNCGEVGLHVGEEMKFSKAKWWLPPCNNEFLNNIVVGTKGVLIRDEGSRVSTWRGNIVHARGEAKAGLEREGIRVADPQLARQQGILRFGKKNSPAINPTSPNWRDVAAPVPGSAVDMDGQPRDEKPDVGSDEWSEAPVLRRPLKPGDAGPNWMGGDPGRVPRIASPKPIPSLRR